MKINRKSLASTRRTLQACRAAACALPLLALAPGSSNAQSNVTMFGTLDSGIEYLTNAGKTTHSVMQASSSLIYGNAIGIKGSEDLGSGASAIFRLEAGFAEDTGASAQGGRLFGRQSWVGLADEKNRILLGRVYTPLYDVIGYLDPLQGSNVSLWTMDGGMVSRMDKAVRYTRTEGPFHYNAQYSFGSDTVATPVNGVAGGAAQSKEATLAADYTTPQLMAGIVYDDIHGPMSSAQYGMSLYVPSLIPATPATPSRARRLATALRYATGNTSLFVGYRHLKTTVQDSVNHSNLFWTGVTQNFKPEWSGTVALYHQRVAGIDARPTLLALQTQYKLSKRTGLYANLGKVWNTRLSNMGVNLQTQTLQGASQVGASIGMFHFF